MSVVWRVDRALLEPGFASDVNQLADDPGEWYVTYGFRTHEVQKALYDKYLAGGPRAAPPGHSAHESGLAVDVALVVDDAGKAHTEWNYTHPTWLRLFDKIKAHPRLHSLVKIGDADHIERVAWRDHRGWKAA
jgi:hypothetical protein